MKNKSIFSLTLFIVIILALVPYNVKAEDYVSGEVLVKFKKGTTQQDANAANSKVQATLIRKMKHSDISHLKLPSNISTTQAIKEFENNPNVEYAQPNYIYRIAATPNDTNYSLLWGLHNIGQTVDSVTGTLDADIDAPTAWDITTGSASITVAVIDTGVKLTHADLSTNIWTNSGETASNSIDDDNNGYVDDVNGWDFVNNDNSPVDDCGHGTHVAGTIAAIGNNAAGTTGVMWTAKIMSLKVLGSTGCTGTTADLSEAIYYAINKSAKIINLSLGSSAYDTTVRDAISNARDNGVLVVAAAGNDGTNNDTTPTYPASYDLDNIISIAATDQNDSLASFSNYGDVSVDLAAPGVNIYSTVPTTAECTYDTSSLCSNTNYNYADGTSMATPHVVGVAGLVWAANPAYSYTQVRNAILNNVNSLACLSDMMVTGGRLNAYQALSGLTSGPAKPTTITATSVSTTQIDLSWTNVTGETGYKIYRKGCSASCSSYILIDTTLADVVTYSDTGLSENTCFKYVIRAFNATDISDYSNEASATTPSSPPSGDLGDTSGGSGHSRNCFIATSAYGNPTHPYVKALREFRDKHLLTNYYGRAFVDFYYKFSPAIAEVIKDSEFMKAVTRVILTPVVMFVVYPYVSLTVFVALLMSLIITRRCIKSFKI